MTSSDHTSLQWVRQLLALSGLPEGTIPTESRSPQFLRQQTLVQQQPYRLEFERQWAPQINIIIYGVHVLQRLSLQWWFGQACHRVCPFASRLAISSLLVAVTSSLDLFLLFIFFSKLHRPTPNDVIGRYSIVGAVSALLLVERSQNGMRSSARRNNEDDNAVLNRHWNLLLNLDTQYQYFINRIISYN